MASLSQRAQRWALRRQGIDRLPLTLQSRRIYIVPTRRGWAFAALIAVIFIAGLNYGNGLAMLLAFWLAAFALVAMLQTHRGLAGTRIAALQAQPAFCGASVQLAVQPISPLDLADLNLCCDDASASIDSRDESSWRLDIPARKRGIWNTPPLKLESRAPFGLFRAWTWLNFELTTLVYPQPGGRRPLPVAASNTPGNLHRSAGHDELSSLRPFRDGDSPRQVAWKAYARGAPLLVREYQGNAGAATTLDYNSLPGLGREERLSQLCQWALSASERREAFTLLLPDAEALSGAGPAQLVRCLRALALFDSGRATP
jgi:uncharacterized protein (DUF58 family)